MEGIRCLVFVAAFCVVSLGAEIRLSKEENECLKKSKFYHEGTKNCYELLTQGPCPEGEWFVMRPPQDSDKGDILRAMCKKDLCDERSFYWDKTEGCVTPSDKERLCGGSETVTLGNNDFGEAECSCLKSPPHVRLNGDPKRPCVQLYRRGPCKRGEIVAFPSEEADAPQCITDPCYEESRYKKASGLLPFNATLAMYNKTCYQLDTQGPCPGNMKFQVSLNDRAAVCTSLTHAIFELGKPDCNPCQQPIEIKNQNEEAYKASVFASLHQWKERQRYLRNNPERSDIVWDEINEDEYTIYAPDIAPQTVDNI